MKASKRSTSDASMCRRILRGLTLGVALSSMAAAAGPVMAGVQLLTPTEYVFANLGRSAGEGVGGAITIAANNAAIDARIKRARSAFHACYPGCGKSVKSELSFALMARDLKLLEAEWLEGMMGGGFSQYFQAMDTIGLRGPKTSVAESCKADFDRWSASYRQKSGMQSGDDWMGNMMGVLNKGTMSSEVLKSTQGEYRQYQLCRDNMEIELAEALR